MAGVSSGRISRRDNLLSPIQTSFTRSQSQRLQRPRPVETVVFEKRMNLSPPRDVPSLDHHKSKSSLLGLFRRSKSAKATKVYRKMEMSRISEDTPGKLQSRGNSERSEQTSNTFYSAQPHVPLTHLNPAAIKLPRRASKIRLNPKLDKKDPSIKSLASWDPPELFKAYPQAVKHARLRAPFQQAETILQIHEEKKRASLDQSGAQDEVDGEMNSAISEGFKRKREKDRKSKAVTAELSCDKWTERVYVLATSGCLLQYAGSGNFDRLPEKIMRLGKDSAAFASDAIDGECYVLQVSRTTNEEGVVSIETSNSVFKRLGFRNEPKSTSSFLLVFDSPDDMNEWLVVVRKEIEALGGRKYRPDVLVHRTAEEDSRQLRGRPSRRFLIQREPYQFAEQVPDGNFNTTDRHEWPILGNAEGSLTTLRRPSWATQKSGDSPSLSNGTTSSDQAHLERLRETPRLSYVSTGAKTLSTSKASSPDPSPARAAFSPEDLIPKPIESPTLTLGIPQIQRSSARTVSASTLPAVPIVNERQGSEPPRIIPTYGSKTHGNLSSPLPNFSVPSFSKRYSCATNINLLNKSPTSTALTRPVRGFSSPTSYDLHRLTKPRKLSLEEWPNSVTSSLETSESKVIETPKIENVRNSPVSLTGSETPIPREKSQQPTARRLSSLEHRQGTSSCNFISNQSPSPHPPPTTALPALPQVQNYDHKRSSDSTLKHRKAQRPISLQVHSDPAVRAKYHPLKNELRSPAEEDESVLSSQVASIPKPRRAPPPPPIPIPKSNIQNRKSMPQMTHRTPSGPLSDFSLLPEISFLLDSENSTQGSFVGPWSSCEAVRGHQLQDTRIK